MSNSERRQFDVSNVLDQEFLDAAFDNLSNQLEMVVDIDTPAGVLRASDRNKYVGEHFYEARTNFPPINRTLGRWLDLQLEFSTLRLEISNVDGKYNSILPAGNDFAGWIDRNVTVRLGLRDVESTYSPIFEGRITDAGGVGRNTKSIFIVARDNFDRLNRQFPTEPFLASEFPTIDDNLIGKRKPVIYGDWTTGVNPEGASVPAFIINGQDASVIDGTANVRLIIAENDLDFFDDTEVYLRRGENFHVFDPLDIIAGAGNKSFQVKQSGDTLIEGEPYTFGRGDTFFVKVRGKDLGAYSDNIIWQARDILLTYGDAVAGDFDANWATYRDKSTPSASNIASFKSRVWIQDPQPAMTYALSLLQQVRLEAFISRDLKIKINSLHWEDMQPDPDFFIRDWDCEKDTFSTDIDLTNNFNRTQGFFNFLPDLNDNRDSTSFFRNNAAISQAGGKVIEKGVVFPNLYHSATVSAQVQEILRMASAYFEICTTNLTWRATLLELGDFVSIDVRIGSSNFSTVPAMIRRIGYDPRGLRIPVTLWSFQMMPFPGYVPGNSGTVGGFNAIITEET